MRRVAAAVILAFACVSQAGAASAPVRSFAFGTPIDAISVGLPGKASHGTISALVDGAWTPPQPIAVEDEQDPTLLESNLVMFSAPAAAVRVEGIDGPVLLHPIRVSSQPTHYDTAATVALGAPRILTRAEWGADESLREAHRSTSSASSSSASSAPVDVGDTGDGRVQDCLAAQGTYPQEFRTTGRTVTVATDGQPLLWPETYSPQIKMFVVHHTAMQVAGDARSGAERMRAIYQYHAVNRGWGDIGYNYVIDDQGQIYEGRAGGDSVVAGHAYCHNIGTIGIALMGNFDLEEPTQPQLQALQHLLNFLAGKYRVNLNGTTVYHGQSLPTVVGHRDLLKTDCPGYYVYGVLAQVRSNAAANPDAVVQLLAPQGVALNPPSVRTSARPTAASPPPGTPFAAAVGATAFSGLPGGQITFAIRLQAGSEPLAQRASIGAVVKSDSALIVMEENANDTMRLGSRLLVPTFLRANAFTIVRMRVQLPVHQGTFTLNLAGVNYRFDAGGRRVRDPLTIRTNRPISYATPVVGADAALASATAPPAPTQTSAPSDTMPRTPARNPTIRIRLSYQADPQNANVAVPSGATVNGTAVSSDVFVRANGSACEAWTGGKLLTSGTIRIDPGAGLLTVTSWNRPANQFRGILECRTLDGKLVLINELPMESYLAGIAEEPDGEPYEKQRAFAIAARSYAAWYLDPAHRKFPGMPYDGSDDPSLFQLYMGAGSERQNPQWARAVQNTAGLVLTFGGGLIKPPYFSSDDGRTRSPSEAGFGSAFPFASIFQSKPDPWCTGLPMSGHGVGMSGCGAAGQANEGKTAEDILRYYYPGTTVADE